jgi:hypothetical protein
MFKEEPIVRFFMAFEVNRELTTQEGAIGDRLLPKIRSSKDSDASAARRREQRHTFRPTSKFSSLEDESIGIMLLRRVNEGKGKGVKVTEVYIRHVDVDVVRPLGLGQVFFIQRLKLRVVSWKENVVAHLHRQGNLIVRGAVMEDKLLWVFLLVVLQGAIHEPGAWLSHRPRTRLSDVIVRGGVKENELLRILLFFVLRPAAIFLSSGLRLKANSSRHHQATNGAGVVGGEAKVAEHSAKGTVRIGKAGVVHGGAGEKRERGVRRGRNGSRSGVGRRERR